jgi:phosphoenolpyruvate-protein phosphotransferase (PTS system enzyme I)
MLTGDSAARGRVPKAGGMSAKEERLKGLALSEGCAVGRVCLMNERRHIKAAQYKVFGDGIDKEVARLEGALGAAAEDLESVRARVAEDIGRAEAEIFVAQKMIVEDAQLRGEIVGCIVEHGLNAEAAVAQVLDRYESRMAAIEDGYLKERAGDLAELKERILNVLSDTRASLLCENEEHCRRGRGRIVVAEELTPAATVDLNRDEVLGFATEHGGVNSHAAILARTLGIPAVSGLQGIRSRLSCGVEIMVDGTSGEVVLWPSETTVSAIHATRTRVIGLPDPVEPVPGFEVLANIGSASELGQALEMKAEGIGLYRTEIEVIAAGRLLDEDMLAERYGAVVRSMSGRRVIFRMFDIGSDKPLPAVQMPKEDNPALGCRGARLLLARGDLLRTQARALARASEHGPIHVMYPMVSGVEQFRRLRELFMKATAGLPAGEIQQGVMLEVPAACFQASEMLGEADFASIGTNDLIQYLFAVDRDNELVADDYNCDTPVFWGLLRTIVHAAGLTGKPLSICGEMAGDPRFIPRLIDLGFTCVSVTPRRISAARQSAHRHIGGTEPRGMLAVRGRRH